MDTPFVETLFGPSRFTQKNSRRLELSISKNTPWEKVEGSFDQVRGRFAFRGAIFPEFSSGTPEQTPETTTAFSSFVIC